MDTAVAYLRVSGKGQVDGDGPERQSVAVNAFCKANNLAAVESFFEAGVSGTVGLLDRPQFTRLIELYSHKGCAVVVERLDRLARDLMVQEMILKECRESGIKVYATDQGLVDLANDDTDPTRKLIRQVLGALAEWEKSALVLKLRKARNRKKEATGRCEGDKPFGHRPGELNILYVIAGFKNQGMTWPLIATALNAEGLPPRNATHWNRDSVKLAYKLARKRGIA